MPLVVPAVLPNEPLPADHGYSTWTYDPVLTVVSTANASGTVSATRIPVRQTITVSTIDCFVSVAGATLTAGQNLLGICTSAGARIAVTADQSAAWVSTGYKTAALIGGPFTIIGGPNVFIYALSLSSGTPPAAFRGLNLLATLVNVNQPVGLGGRSVLQTGQTTIPTTFAPAALDARTVWFGLR